MTTFVVVPSSCAYEVCPSGFSQPFARRIQIVFRKGSLPMSLRTKIISILSKATLSLRVGTITLLGAVSCQQMPPSPETLAEYSSLSQNERTTAVVLGTVHTSNLSGIDGAAFNETLKLLIRENFDAVAVERLPASEIESLATNPEFDPVLEQFVGALVEIARRAQADMEKTSAEATSVIGTWVKNSDAETALERRDRAMLALAAFELETALIYWDSSDENLYPSYAAEHLNLHAGSLNERVALGVAIAKRMDHPRVWPIDSHADKDLFFSIVPDLQIGMVEYNVGEEVEALANVQRTRELEREAVETNELIDLLAYLNQPKTMREDVIGQFDVFNRVPFPKDSGRMRLAAWDERNIRIAANIRRATASHSSGRLLIIIGAGHKPFLDELLPVSLDLQIEQIDFGGDQ